MKPWMVEVTNGKVALDQEHVLEEGASGVSPIGHAFIQRPVSHVLKEHHGFLHNVQNLLGPEVRFLQITWRKHPQRVYIHTFRFIPSCMHE